MPILTETKNNSYVTVLMVLGTKQQGDAPVYEAATNPAVGTHHRRFRCVYQATRSSQQRCNFSDGREEACNFDGPPVFAPEQALRTNPKDTPRR